MIEISNKRVTPEEILKDFRANEVERKVIRDLHESNNLYSYNSLDELKFEANLRFYIVRASVILYRSGFKFEVFRKSFCNENFFERTRQGGFLTKPDISPYKAINDIFDNGRKYGTECATAIVIIYYKAVADILKEDLFNRLFPRIHLMNWHYIDNDLNIRNYSGVKDQIPGDCLYFKNPDVDPTTPEWQGENAIVLGNGQYYGHGIGIRREEEIISILNRKRKEGSDRSAYLLDSATRLDSKKLYSIYKNYN